MDLFGAAANLEQFEDSDGLRFRVTSQRKVETLIIPVVAGAGLMYARHQDVSQLALLGLTALLLISIWRWFKVWVIELRVTAVELVVEGDLDRATGTLWLQWAEITRLQYIRGSEEISDGLYAQVESGTHVCLVPHVSEAQANTMIRAIYSRFPYLVMAEEQLGTRTVH
jgi:hypothetical protein